MGPLSPPEKLKTNQSQSQPNCAFAIAHQGQHPYQVSLNLADPHFQGLTRFLNQGLLINGVISTVGASVREDTYTI